MIVTLCISVWKVLTPESNNRPWTYKRGDHIASLIWQTMPDARPTVVLVNRSGCHFCTASMPFYAELVRVAADVGAEVVSVTPEDTETNKQYLDLNHVQVDRIVRLKDTPLKVSGTPTLIVVDRSKTVLGAWVGELASDDEQ